jgi:hypothetical protein
MIFLFFYNEYIKSWSTNRTETTIPRRKDGSAAGSKQLISHQTVFFFKLYAF